MIFIIYRVSYPIRHVISPSMLSLIDIIHRIYHYSSSVGCYYLLKSDTPLLLELCTYIHFPPNIKKLSCSIFYFILTIKCFIFMIECHIWLIFHDFQISTTFHLNMNCHIYLFMHLSNQTLKFMSGVYFALSIESVIQLVTFPVSFLLISLFFAHSR